MIFSVLDQANTHWFGVVFAKTWALFTQKVKNSLGGRLVLALLRYASLNLQVIWEHQAQELCFLFKPIVENILMPIHILETKMKYFFLQVFFLKWLILWIQRKVYILYMFVKFYHRIKCLLNLLILVKWSRHCRKQNHHHTYLIYRQRKKTIPQQALDQNHQQSKKTIPQKAFDQNHQQSKKAIQQQVFDQNHQQSKKTIQQQELDQNHQQSKKAITQQVLHQNPLCNRCGRKAS